MKDFLQTAPVKLILVLAVAYGLLWSANFGLIFWQGRLNNAISQNKNKIDGAINSLNLNALSGKEYSAFIQFLYLEKLIGQRRSPVVLLNNIDNVLPKELTVKGFQVDVQTGVFEIKGTAPNLFQAVRVIAYFKTSPNFTDLNDDFNIDPKTGAVDLTFDGKLNKNLFNAPNH